MLIFLFFLQCRFVILGGEGAVKQTEAGLTARLDPERPDAGAL